MSYRAKKENETWNEYLIKIFRESGNVNFCIFLDKYFKFEDRLAEYRIGIEKEKELRELKITKKEKATKDTPEKKVTFAKKPERVKQKKGYLF